MIDLWHKMFGKLVAIISLRSSTIYMIRALKSQALSMRHLSEI